MIWHQTIQVHVREVKHVKKFFRIAALFILLFSISSGWHWVAQYILAVVAVLTWGATAYVEGLEDGDKRCAPVVRGHMIGAEEAQKIFEETYSDYPYGQCSVCGHCDWDCVESQGFNFCPNCGAEMTGGNGNE